MLRLLTYRELGSLMFNFELLGYGLMSISTFLGLTALRSSRISRWLRWLFIGHGVFAPMCVVLWSACRWRGASWL